jgi:hypothetical protein
MSLDQTYTIDFNNLSFYDGDFKKSDDFSDLIYENEGSVCLEEEWISFIPVGNDDVNITVEYSLELRGYFDECPGDYWTPPACDFCLDEATVSINRFFIDDVEVELFSEIEKILMTLVENKIGI